MDFSIVLASRSRVGLLRNLLESIKKTTADISNVEVFVGIDDDDAATHAAAITLKQTYDFVKFESRKRSRKLNRDYLNWLITDHSKGKYIIVVNDDTEFITKDWDNIFRRKLKDYLSDKPDGIVYGFIKDGLTHRYGLGYCCFPLISKAGVEATGIGMPPECAAWNADVILWRIYVRVERVCDLSEVEILHLSRHNGTRECDEINLHVQELSKEPDVIDINVYVNKLKKAMLTPPLLEVVKSHYTKTIEYHRSVGYDTGLDVIWANNMSDIGRIVNESNTAFDLIDKVDQTFMYSINFPPENGQNTGVWQSPNDVPLIRHKQIDWLLNKQLLDGLDVFSLPAQIQESVFIHDRNKTVINDRVLSGNFLRTLSIANRIVSHIDKSEIKSIIELGGGCGHQARTLSLLLPDAKYTIVDLPETLIFAFTFISLNFPGKKKLFVTCEADVAKVDEYDFVFCPAVFAHLLHGRSYDLFINTASMGEMTNATIHRWMDFIQNKINLKYLFTLNRYLNVVNEGAAHYRRIENECSTSYDHKWKILNWEIEPIYTRCPFIDTLHSRYVEIFAKRTKEPGANWLVKTSQELLKDALDEDWYRLKGYYSDGLMQYRSNVLVNDTTMTGTLFKLWESIRLDQRIDNVNAMLEYLSRIIVKQSYAFEEAFYYEALLGRLIAAKESK